MNTFETLLIGSGEDLIMYHDNVINYLQKLKKKSFLEDYCTTFVEKIELAKEKLVEKHHHLIVCTTTGTEQLSITESFLRRIKMVGGYKVLVTNDSIIKSYPDSIRLDLDNYFNEVHSKNRSDAPWKIENILPQIVSKSTFYKKN